ncbi:MAG: malonyl-ACP O-methyltransferase BioC [Cellvibrionales bacterium]|nr:malonyl-ACP O-methyltransferase BioC [Cellvibrionales bacterium]
MCLSQKHDSSLWVMNRYEGSRFTATNDLPACVLVSGWGLSTQVFDLILPSLALQFDVYRLDRVFSDKEVSFAQASESLHRVLLDFFKQSKKPYWLMGWSLGGNLALQAAKPRLVGLEGLFLVATTPKFIADESFPLGVVQSNFQAIQQRLEKNTAKSLAYFDRLQVHGDEKAEVLVNALKSLRQVEPKLSKEQLMSELEWLYEVDQREALAGLRQSVYWFFGEHDPLVSSDLAKWITDRFPKMVVTMIEGATHPIFLSQSEGFLSQLENCIASESRHQEKIQMANRFSKAAVTYDSYAHLQQLVGEKLLAKIKGKHFHHLLDAGCGTGFFSEELACHSQHLLGVDLASGMLDYAKQNHSGNALWIQADIESLPLQNASVDAIFSSLAVQWVESLSALLNEWHRLLVSGGEVLISTLGPKSLFELRGSFESIDKFQHVNQFLPFDAVLEIIKASPLTVVDTQSAEEVLTYPSCVDVMKDLKGIGATLVKGKQSKGLMTKERLTQLVDAYNAYQLPDGSLPATYEVIYLHLQKA